MREQRNGIHEELIGLEGDVAVVCIGISWLDVCSYSIDAEAL